jgi:hypothetical protein
MQTFPHFNFLAYHFDRPSKIVNRFGMFTSCVQLNDLNCSYNIGEKVERWIEERNASALVEQRPPQAAFFYQKKLPMEIVETYIKWPCQSFYEDPSSLYSEPNQLDRNTNPNALIVGTRLNHNANLLKGLSDMHASVCAEKEFQLCRGNKNKIMRCIQPLDSIDLRYSIFQEGFPELREIAIEQSPESNCWRTV